MRCFGLLANQIDAAVLGELVTGVAGLAKRIATDKHQVLHALLEIVANPASDQGATALASGVTHVATGADDKRHARRVLFWKGWPKPPAARPPYCSPMRWPGSTRLVKISATLVYLFVSQLASDPTLD